MKTFIATWLGFWILATFIGWFCNPGSDFREMAGNETVFQISFFIGWVPALGVALNYNDKKTVKNG